MKGLWIKLTESLSSFRFGGMAPHSDIYQRHLDQVSRSFAFCIRQLPSPLREWVGLSYLLCRVLDTIEDAPWARSEDQFLAFQGFDEALRAKCDLEENWLEQFPADVPEGEKALLVDAKKLFIDLHTLPGPVRETLVEVISVMSAGMQHFCRTQEGRSLRLKSLAEVNQYCFFVAGVVGELLAKVLARIEPKFRLNQNTILRAHHFGLFLQKVNLLKDQATDEKLGRHLVPSREKVEASSEENAREALRFLLNIPNEQIEFRRFCAWSLFLGLESLLVVRKADTLGGGRKVSRERTDLLLKEVEGRLHEGRDLESLFAQFASHLGWTTTGELKKRPGESVPPWFLRLYHGGLEEPQLYNLGIVS